MGVDLVIFDCDGVLVDSEQAGDDAVWAALREFGLDADAIEREVFGTYFGRGLSDALMWERIEEHGVELPEGLKEAFACNEKVALESVKVMAGAREAVELVSGMVPVCVASSGSHEKMELTLGGTGLLPLFNDHVFSATQVKNGKPAPDLFLFAASLMGVEASECLVIEDSYAGVSAGLAAGMQVLGYAPHGDVDKLGSLGVRLLNHHDQLAETVGYLRTC
jgi:HAD superfamily hydrolase (TIGR01509 family)